MSTRSVSAGTVVVILAGSAAGSANAADCLGGGLCACPVTGVTAFCETTVSGGGPGSSAICTKTPGAGGSFGTPDLTFTCVLDRNGGSGGGDVVLILDTSAGDFEASGSDASGNPFCCKMRADPWGGMVVRYIETQIQGTTHNDIDIAHTYVDGAATVWNLQNPAAWIYTHGIVNGNEGLDTIWGSNAGGNSYHEWLNGDEGGDTIHGGDYWDHINGGSGADDLFGDGGPDTITGASGEDYIEGGNEPCVVGVGCLGDDIDGGPDADIVFGGDANDIIHGGGGADCLDGELDDDTIYGELDADTIVGGAGADTIFGGAGNDIVDVGTDGDNDVADGNTQTNYYVPADAGDTHTNFAGTVGSATCD